jgi:nucleotide-binding universal stress UspA family protein
MEASKMSEKYVVLAAIDLNQGSTRVVEEALEIAARHPGSALHVLTVREAQLPLAMYPVSLVPMSDTPKIEDTANFCRDLVAKGAPDKALSEISVHATVGLPADEIVWFAAHLGADVVVVATHGRRGLKRLLLGSVAEKVVRLAGCPVVVVREKSHDLNARAPEIEPLCPECASKRFETKGAELWCARHAEHHVRAHVRHYEVVGNDAPHAWSSATGT